MNLVLIGKFIAEERKRKGYTQKQLSEKLGISDKTISEWECGNEFPDASLIFPLCNELDITVNDLISGQRVSLVVKEEKKKKLVLTIAIGVISAVAVMTLLLLVCIYT